jgi:hypothetical protein
LSFTVVKTNAQGRALFERLASGRYRVWTKTVERCGGQELSISKLVPIGNSGTAHTQMVIGGKAVTRITSSLGPLLGRGVSLSPDPPPQSPWRSQIVALTGRRSIETSAPPGCSGMTDADGRVTFSPFPPGAAQLRIRLFNSSYIARINVPEGGREMVIAVPDGLIPVKAIDQVSHQPVAAQLAWVGGGARVEALANANGDALLEGVGALGGTLTISAREYQTVEGAFAETPETAQEVPLLPLPGAMVTVRVISNADEAIAGAVVALLGRSAADVDEFSAADAKGMATFLDVPAGELRFTAHAEGFASATVQIKEDSRGSIVMTLTRLP